MVDARTLFPKEYVAAHDLDGKDVTLTISRVEMEDLRTDAGTERKPIVHFAEMDKRPKDKRKRLVLNITNMRSIAKALGSFETDDWPGGKITLYPTTCPAFGEIRDCIRVREK